MTYTLKINQIVQNNTDRVWTTVTVTVTDCMITSIIPPPAPVSGTSYSIHALSNLIINLDTPGFLQTPACGYTLNENISWSIPTGAPITMDAANRYKVTVSSTDNMKDSIYTVTINNVVSYLNSAGQTQNWTPSTTF